MAKEFLTDRKCRSAKPGRHFDGGGLHLFVRKSGARSWVLRYRFLKQDREMGLGAYPEVTLAEAREEATRWRRMAKQKSKPIDPQQERERLANEAERKAIEAARARTTFSQVFDLCYEAKRAELKNDGKGWDYPVRVHLVPKIGDVPIEDLSATDIANALRPIWRTKPDAARKAAQRADKAFRHAVAMKLPVDRNAVPDAREILGPQGHKAVNVPALHWKDVPDFYAGLGITTVELVLRLIVLTGVRSGEARGATLDEFNLEAGLWEIPADRMKMGRPFRVALSGEAVQVVRLAKQSARAGMLFPGNSGAKPLSDMAMTQWFRRQDISARAHGFRSSLRTWLAECTDAPREVAEACLAHETGDKVETAYRRTDFLEQRRVLMQRWADHCTGGTGAVVALVG